MGRAHQTGAPFDGESLTLTSPNGAVEDLSADAIESAVEGLVRQYGGAIERGTLASGERRLDDLEPDLEPIIKAVEEGALRAAMLGALDAEHEMTARPVDRAEFARQLKARGPWTRRPFKEAIKAFLARKVVTPDVFAEMGLEARRNAFTVAGLTKTNLVADIRGQLAEALEAGEDLNAFKRRLRDGLKLKGWLRPGPRKDAPTKSGSPWHVQTIYRNGVIGSYSQGRVAQMTQPHVLAARPYWQIHTVQDGRIRETHSAQHLKVYAASDEFWSTSGAPPWGHNCRCRIVSLSEKQAQAAGISEGTDGELPDDGWSPNVITLGRIV